MNKILIQSINLACYIHDFFIYRVNLSNIFLYCRAAARGKNLMSTCPGLIIVQPFFSCLTALTNPDIDMSCFKFSSSLVDIKFCRNQ